MYHRLHDDYGLRGWDGAPHALRHLPSGKTTFLSEAQFCALSFCDGRFDCDGILVTPAHKKYIESAVKNGVAVPCEKGSALAEKQKYHLYPCKYISAAHWSITGRCNLRCRHCYMSAPQGKYGEISREMAMNIVDQLADAGIASVNLTGGEPFVRDDFWDIVDALSARGIAIRQVYTNGLLLDTTVSIGYNKYGLINTTKMDVSSDNNSAILDEFDKRGIKPEFSLSLDGVGKHDWLRGVEGAEKAVINAIKQLKARGYRVSVESAFHRDNVDTIVGTMELLADLGVNSWKTNPASSVGNWQNEPRELDLTAGELYDTYLGLISEYFIAGSPLDIQLGGFFACKKGGRDYTIPCKKSYKDENKRLRDPLCASARSMMYISADAKVLPCMPLAGLSVQNEFPSLHDMTITQALSDSAYLNRINAPVSKLLEHQPTCAACEHRMYCNGGCRAAALVENNGTDYFGIDSWICEFFRGGYEEKIKSKSNSFKSFGDGAKVEI